MIVENLLNLIDIYHQNRLRNFYNNHNLDCLIDVGSHKGEFINHVADHNLPIFSFEPQESVRHELLKNTKNFNVLEYYDFALSDFQGDIEFFISRLSSTSSILRPNESSFWIKFKTMILRGSLIQEIKKVNTFKLDDVLEDKIQNYESVLLKIDVEGAEGRVLRGCERILHSEKIKFVQLEEATFDIYKDKTDNPYSMLKEFDYYPIKKYTFPLLNFKDVIYSKKTPYLS